MAIAATTELEAVNTMLGMIGETPVSSLTGTLPASATVAQNLLTETARSVQARGWHFNTDYEVTLTPDGSDEIVLPTNALRVDIDNDLVSDVVIRGGKLYDKNENSYTFNNSIEATIVYGLDFEDLPEYAREYIMCKAGRRFQDRFVGSVKHAQFTREDEIMALTQLKANENRQANHSIFSNYDTYLMVQRRSALHSIR